MWLADFKAGVFAVPHGGVAMGVERQDGAVHFFGAPVFFGLLYEMSEEGPHASVAAFEEAFGMPLYGCDGFHSGAFKGFRHAVGGACRYPQCGAGISYGLMVEGVDAEGCSQQVCHA